MAKMGMFHVRASQSHRGYHIEISVMSTLLARYLMWTEACLNGCLLLSVLFVCVLIFFQSVLRVHYLWMRRTVWTVWKVCRSRVIAAASSSSSASVGGWRWWWLVDGHADWPLSWCVLTSLSSWQCVSITVAPLANNRSTIAGNYRPTPLFSWTQ